MDVMGLQNLVKGWHARARREADPISKFVFLWFCFNAWLSYESDKDRDDEMIKWLKGRPAGSGLVSSFEAGTASDVFRAQLQTLANLSPIESTRRHARP